MLMTILILSIISEVIICVCGIIVSKLSSPCFIWPFLYDRILGFYTTSEPSAFWMYLNVNVLDKTCFMLAQPFQFQWELQAGYH